MVAATSPLCGMTTSTSTPCVRRFSDCCTCALSSQLADCTSTSAPSSLARATKRSRSRCQRSSLSVSIESPMRTGPVLAVPPPAPPGCCAGCTQASIKAEQTRAQRATIETQARESLYVFICFLTVDRSDGIGLCLHETPRRQSSGKSPSFPAARLVAGVYKTFPVRGTCVKTRRLTLVVLPLLMLSAQVAQAQTRKTNVTLGSGWTFRQ